MGQNRVARTLIDMLHMPSEANSLGDSTLLVIDAQREYVDGQLPLTGVDAALTQIARLQKRARAIGAPVVHVVHHAPVGAGIFDPSNEFSQIAAAVMPVDDEAVVSKHYPNSFTESSLAEVLEKHGRKKLIVVGFMTHMCVSATSRAGLDRGFNVTVVDGACATRDLPDGKGGQISAEVVHQANLAALADLVATIVGGESDIKD